MHKLALNTYQSSCRNQGRYLMMLTALSFFTMPLFAPDATLVPSFAVTALGFAVGLLLLKPNWQPSFIAAPQGFLKCIGAMLASNVVFLIAMALGYVAVLNMNLQEPQSRNIAIFTALPTLLLTGLMWCSALALIAFKPKDDTPDKALWTPPPPDTGAVALQNPRKSRAT